MVLIRLADVSGVDVLNFVKKEQEAVKTEEKPAK